MMKRIAIVAIVLIIISGACTPTESNQQVYDVSKISGISFVWVDHDGIITVEETLDPNLFPEFLTDLSQLSTYSYWNDPVDCIYGSAIMISFYDGSYHMINSYCTLYYHDDSVDDTRQYYRPEDFKAFWEQYSGYQYRHDSSD